MPQAPRRPNGWFRARPWGNHTEVNPLRIGLIAVAIATVMFITELVWEPVFTVELGDFRLPVWILIAIYGALQLVLWQLTKEGMELTTDEVDKWGKQLELATPKILEGYQAKKKVREIAKEIEASDGIPEHITLRYIVALARHAQTSEE